MEEKKKGFFARLKEGLTKTRNSIVSGIDSVFRGFTDIDDDFYEEIEEILIMGDLGVDATEKILTDMKQKVKELHLKEPHECKEVLIDSIRRQMDLGENAYEFEHRKSVVLVIGVNGVGKTTSIGKLADQLKAEGNSVLLQLISLKSGENVQMLVLFPIRKVPTRQQLFLMLFRQQRQEIQMF